MEKIKKILKEIYQKSPEHIKPQVKELADYLKLSLEKQHSDIIRIAHISDIHISEKLTIAGMHIIDNETGKPKKLIDIERCFLFAVDKAIKYKCNIALITEPFDRPNPTPNELSVFVKGVELLSKYMPVIIEPGNHGLDRNRKNESAFNVFKNYYNVYVVDKPKSFFFDGEVLSEEYEENQKGLFIHVLPYPIMYVNTSDKNEIKNIMLEWIEKFKLSGTPSILFSHLMVDSILNPKIINRIREPVFSIDELQGFSYVALGHVHRFIELDERIYYSGNIERIDFDEETEQKGFIIADLNIKTNDLNVNFIETPATEFINLTVSDFLKLTENDINKNAVYRIIGEIPIEEKVNYVSHLTKMEKINPNIMSKVKIVHTEKKKKTENIFHNKIYEHVDSEQVLIDYLSSNISNKDLIDLVVKVHKEIQGNLKR